jgi:hypothetical protein
MAPSHGKLNFLAFGQSFETATLNVGVSFLVLTEVSIKTLSTSANIGF